MVGINSEWWARVYLFHYKHAHWQRNLRVLTVLDKDQRN